MTGQTLLNTMELLNAELQLQAGEADVNKGLLALNVAQDYFESLASAKGKIFGSSTSALTTAQNTESTNFPAGVLRVDRIQLLDQSTLRPKRELRSLKRAGGHVGNFNWPVDVVSSSSGEPKAYWTNGTSIYWSPLPAGAYNLRLYGFVVAADITASGTFTYPDVVSLPLASFAARLIKMGLDDTANDVAGLAQETFSSVLSLLSNGDRDGAVGLEYTQIHDA